MYSEQETAAEFDHEAWWAPVTDETHQDRRTRIVAQLKDDCCRRECGEKAGLSLSVVDRTMRKYGLHHDSYHEISETTAKVLNALRAGASRKECEEMFGVSKGTIAGIARRNKVSVPRDGLKFTPERDRIIRLGYPPRPSAKEITDQCNATPGPPVTKTEVISRAYEIRVGRYRHDK